MIEHLYETKSLSLAVNVSEVEALYELYKKLSNSLVNDRYIQKVHHFG